MADIDFKDPSGPSSPNLASMIQRYNEANARVNPSEASRSALSSAIGANAADNVNKALDIGSTVTGIASTLGVEMNPYLQGILAARNIINAPNLYQQQAQEDFAKYGDKRTGIGTLLRSDINPLSGVAKFFSGKTSRPDLDPKFKQYLASRGVDPNSWEGPPIVGPSPRAPVTGPFGTKYAGMLPAPIGMGSPWVNPNFPNPNPMIDLNAIQQRAVQSAQDAQIAKAEQSAQATIDRSIQGDMIDSGDYNDDDYGAMFDGIDDYSVG